MAETRDDREGERSVVGTVTIPADDPEQRLIDFFRQCVRETVAEVEPRGVTSLAEPCERAGREPTLKHRRWFDVDAGVGEEVVEIARALWTDTGLEHHGGFDEAGDREPPGVGLVDRDRERQALGLVEQYRQQRRRVDTIR